MHNSQSCAAAVQPLGAAVPVPAYCCVKVWSLSIPRTTGESNPACPLTSRSKHAIVVADKKLGNSCTIHETIRVKSAAWDDTGEGHCAGCGAVGALRCAARAAVCRCGTQTISTPAWPPLLPPPLQHDCTTPRGPTTSRTALAAGPAFDVTPHASLPPSPPQRVCSCTPRSTTSSTACPTVTTASSAPWTSPSTSPRCVGVDGLSVWQRVVMESSCCMHPGRARMPHQGGWRQCSPRGWANPGGGDLCVCQGPGAESFWPPLLSSLQVHGTTLFCLDREAKPRQIQVGRVFQHLKHSITSNTRGLRLLGTCGREAGWQCMHAPYGVRRPRELGKDARSSAHGGSDRLPFQCSATGP